MRLECVRVTLKDFSAERGHASFVFTPADQTGMGMIAIAAAALGQSGAAAGTLVQSSDLEEAAYQVSFTIDGKPASGWLWFAPFKNGDEVDVVVRWQDDHYEVMAIARPSDRTVALYPHLSRGRKAHWKAVWKTWLWGVVIVVGGVMAFGFLFVTWLNRGFDRGDIVWNSGCLFCNSDFLGSSGYSNRSSTHEVCPRSRARLPGSRLERCRVYKLSNYPTLSRR